MVKRKTVEAGIAVSPTKVAKKNKKKVPAVPVVTQPLVGQPSPKKQRSKASNSLQTTPSKKHTSHSFKHSFDVNAAEEQITDIKVHSRKKKEKNAGVEPVVKIKHDSDSDEEESTYIKVQSPKKKAKKEKNVGVEPVVKIKHDSDSDAEEESTYIKVQSPKKKAKKEKHVVEEPLIKTKPESDSEDEPPVSSSPLGEEHEAEVGVEEGEIDLMEIPKADLVELLNGIKKLLPETDRLAPKFRAKKLKWELVAFGEYTAERCAKIWDAILRRQRQFRYMHELVEDAMGWLDTPWKTANSKNNSKHPDFPKRPKSSFLHYIADITAEYKQDNKEVKIMEISRIASQRFKLLTDDERQEYIDRAAIGMRKYEEQVEQFYQKYPHLKIEAAPKYLGPKKPRAPFTIFLDDHLSSEEHVADKSAYRMASKEAWNHLKDKKKLKWIRLAVAEHAQYLRAVEAYNAAHPDEPVKAAKGVLNKEEQDALHKAEGRPIKPPMSAYTLYVQSMMKDEEFALMGARERVKAIGAKWAQVSKDDKKKFEKKLHQMQENYKSEFEAYLEKLPEEQRLKVQQEFEKKKKPKKEKIEKEKRKSISKRDITIDAIPKLWSAMTTDDKELYKSAVTRVRTYFEAKLNTSIQLKENVPESDDDNADDNADDNDDDDDHGEVDKVKKDKSNEESDEESEDSDEESE